MEAAHRQSAQLSSMPLDQPSADAINGGGAAVPRKARWALRRSARRGSNSPFEARHQSPHRRGFLPVSLI